MQDRYLKGLNTLRFLAAFFVVISHASIGSFYPGNTKFTFLERGGDAVEFFFTLSGFLITYLLFIELKSSNDISIKQFYLRRIFRIWPLYFFVTFIGFTFFEVIYPKLFHQQYFSFPLINGILCFVFFIPNYITSHYSSGLLNPLWSIGVEEQFYLFWAPLVKIFKNNLLSMIIVFVSISIVFYGLVNYHAFDFDPGLRKFLLTQKFYAMGIGCLFGYIIHHYYEWYRSSFFAMKLTQALIIAVIVIHYFHQFSFSHEFYFHVLISVLYGLLIINVSLVKEGLINIEKKPFVYLGVISYGIYMYHMMVDYALRFIFPKLISIFPMYVLIPSYFVLMLGVTIAIAALSHRYIERYFLNFKKG